MPETTEPSAPTVAELDAMFAKVHWTPTTALGFLTHMARHDVAQAHRRADELRAELTAAEQRVADLAAQHKAAVAELGRHQQALADLEARGAVEAPA